MTNYVNFDTTWLGEDKSIVLDISGSISFRSAYTVKTLQKFISKNNRQFYLVTLCGLNIDET